jgi:membrane-associated phospholipid phosphatase
MHHPISIEQKQKRILRGVFRFFSLKLLLIGGLFLVSIFLFALIAHEAVYEHEQVFDNAVFSFFASHTTASLVSVMKIFTFFGSSYFLFPAYVVIISLLILKKKYRYGLHVGIVAISATVLMLTLKEITHRSRPELPLIAKLTNYSFPSGHALSIFILCGILVYIVWHQQIRTPYKWLYSFLFLCFALTVGISRIVLKVHYPTDVAAGFCLGNAWSIMSLWVMRQISKRQAAKKALAATAEA